MKKTLLTTALAITSLCASAQIDLSKYYLTNYGFDQDYNYTATQSDNVGQEIKPVTGWTSQLTADYTIVGTYELGFQGVYNTAKVPSKGYDGTVAGGGLAISTGWEQTFIFYQEVSLPAGTYTINAPTYNGSDQTAATSQLAWVPSIGTATKSSVASYPIGEWTLDQITFTLSKTTKGKIQFGMKAPAGSSGNAAKLFVDYIQIIGENVTVDKTDLSSSITTANGLYGNGAGNGASDLKAAIDAAQAVADNADADLIAVLEATSALKAAIDTYRTLNVSEENPLDQTSLITNPSFEDGTKGWSVSNLSSQSNTSFTKKSGSIYLEKWVGSGSKVGSASVKQTLTDLPNGIYTLTVAAQNYNQASILQQCEGAVIFADDKTTPAYTPNNYSVKFTNLTGEVEIGFEAIDATGNWLAVDNFRLSLIGYITETAILEETARLSADAEALLPLMMAANKRDALSAATEAVKAITGASDEADIQKAIKDIRLAISEAKVSISEYAALEAAIQATEAVYDDSKAGAAELKAEIDKAKELHANGSASSEDLAAEIIALETATLAFNLANATEGTGTAPAVTSVNKYVATGATEALVRASMTGSNILERGVCWSTEHNPTVLDNRTTKSFSLNGYIFHIKGLTPATVYYVRPYVMNKTYTVAYGEEVKIVTHPTGTCKGTWNEGAPDEAANTRCRNAIKETIDYFNEWTGIQGFTLTGNYGANTPTADCSYGGWMRIGPNAGNQAIGTVLHETGHGVGVGTHWRWYDCSDTRADQGKYGAWLGREANDVYHFLENKYTSEYHFKGDAVHGWGNNATYDWLVNGADKDTHQELQYIGGMCILYGLFIDGLCPTSSDPNGIAGYTYNFDDSKKYYLMCKDADRGLGEGLLYMRNSNTASWNYFLSDETVSDSAAWYIEYVPTKGYYAFKNVESGKYLTHSTTATTMGMKTASKPGTTEYFQLMPDRTDVTIGEGSDKLTTHGYWFTWYSGGNKAMRAKAFGKVTGYGATEQASFDYSDNATAQQWIIISEDELEAYKAAYVSTGIGHIYAGESTADGTKTVTGIFSVDGVRLHKTAKGMNIIKYSNGSSKVIRVQ